jgi:hypothetical protein
VATKMATRPATKSAAKKSAPKKQVMQIYRAADRRPSETDASSEKIQPMSPETIAGFARLVDAGVMDGAMVKTLFEASG